MSNTNDMDTTTVSAEELEILAYWMEQERQARLKSLQIKPRQMAGDPPLSFAQQRLWILDQMADTGAAYNLTMGVKILGPLRHDVVEKCLTEILRRHEVLRTTIDVKDDEPFQIIHPPVPVNVEFTDLTDLIAEHAEKEAKKVIAKTGRFVFDLAQGPLLRSHLLRLKEQEHVLVFCMHHIVSDGWSLDILLNEFAALYEAYQDGKKSPLAELPVQYTDYAVWQRNWLAGDELKRQLDYWSERLDDLATLELPTDRIRPSIPSFKGGMESINLGKELKQSLVNLARQQGVTLFILSLAAFTLLLRKYCGQDDIVLGSPIANRNRIEIEGLIGFFVNMLVLRTDVSGNPSFLELLARVRDTAFDAYDHQDLPFERLVDELKTVRDMSRNPLFQVSFLLQEKQVGTIQPKGDLSLSPIPVSAPAVRFDLEFHLTEGQQDLSVLAVYNTDMFNADTIARMLKHYQTLLAGIVADPDRCISELPMLAESERHQLLDEWNQTAAAYPRDKTVHELFEAQVAASPEAVAVEFEGQALTYAQLNERANRLAHYLRARGVGPEVLVGLYLERSLEMTVSLLAILKAGGAYVPLDLDYPQSRITFMLEDARVPVLLSVSALSDGLPDFAGELVCLDSDWAKIESKSADNPVPSATADNLAYVIYTSGSTGTPKGVEIPHRAINRLVRNTDYYQVDATDRIAQASNVSFDAATFEIWGALLNGAQLVGINKEVLLNSKSLTAFLQEQGISLMFLTTALFNQIAREAPGAFKGLRCLMFGGEAVDPGAVRQVLTNQPPERLLHVYGPTESTTFASWYQVENVPADASTVPIGRPLANTTLYILDKNMNPVPVGVPGELYIGGDGLARGYLNRPELTAERFMPDPRHPESTLYRTGDKVRYCRDGAIEYLGRFDHQVKLRGFRVELGEIESVLLRQPVVSDAVVIVHEEEPGDKRLVAYVVAGSSDAPSEADLRDFVVKSLPNYMVPAAFVVLEKLPLTANGKVDRKALPVPGDVRASLGAEYTAPRTELEQQLAQIWAEVLKLERVGIHDNFFDLGGHSLMATQVVSRIRGQLNIELPLSEMFGYPTVAELAPVVESLMDANEGDAAEMIPVVDRGGELPLSFAQERLWFLNQLEPDSTAYNMSLAIRLKGELDVAALINSLNAIVDRQESLRTHFTMHQGKPIQVIEDVEIELAQDELLVLPPKALEREVKARIDAEALQPFDLSTGPLLRGRLLRLSDHEHVLLLTMHHIIYDGWSLGVLFRELGACYAAFGEDEQPVLAELPIQYADFAAWQREWLSGEQLEIQLAYWREKLEGLSALNLPTDRSRPSIQTYAGAYETLRLDVELSKQLTSLSKQAGVTLFMTLLGTFVVLMHRYSGQDDVVIGSPIANRNRSELEDLIGFFINMLVLRLDLTGNPGFRELLGQVQETALGAYQHQDIPFEKLVEILQPTRDRSRNPLFQVQFALQNAPMEALKLGGLSLEPVSGEAHTTRFDLECHILSRGTELDVVFNYNVDLFEAPTIDRMLAHYRQLLGSIVENPDQSIDDLQLLTEEEQQQFAAWNQTVTDYPRNETVHELFGQQVSVAPDSIAVEYEGKTLSYAELNNRANQVAHYLQARGVGPEVRVGICVERSLEMVVGVLGILKAGGAYVPLDTDYPKPRLAYMLEDAQVPVLLSMSPLRDLLPDFAGELVCLDADWTKIERESTENPVSKTTADNLIYVIYTSGSTGRPKGTLIEHRSAVRLVKETNYVELGADEVFLQFAPISFDASTFELWGSLLNGAKLVVFPAGPFSLEGLARTIHDKGVTTLWLTSALFSQMVDDHLSSLSGVRQLLAGGEALSLPHVQKVLDQLGDRRLINGYGPTENTTFTCCHVMTSSSDVEQSVPIGRPISNTTVYVLDKQMKPVPVGVPGELYIGGDGLARGYLNQPELTAEKFVADPFSEDPTARLYRTGDNVRYRSDGEIEFLGRFDDQIKLRGFRIELGEIETALSHHEAVRDAVALLREDQPGDKRLVAYVVAKDTTVPTVEELRVFMRERLPEYMVPSALMVLNSFPLTANGKVDRKALPVPGDMRASLGAEYTAPRTELEQQLTQIWAEVLKLERIGIHDNFFNLGGHSLMATQIVSRIRELLKLDLPVASLFDHSTVAAMAEYIETMRWAKEGQAGENLDSGEHRHVGEL